VDLARDADEVAGQLDELVAPADEPENAVLVDNAHVVRWAGPAFALFSLILLQPAVTRQFWRERATASCPAPG
jgi:hypothetical protein